MSEYGSLPTIPGLEDGDRLKNKMASKTSLVGEIWVLLRDFASMNKAGELSKITVTPNAHTQRCAYHPTQEPTHTKT